MDAFTVSSTDLQSAQRWDVSFMRMRQQYGAKAEELTQRFSADEVRQMLSPIALQDLAVLLPLGRNGRDRLTRSKVDLMIREYPHMALAAVVDDLEASNRRSHDAIAAAYRYKAVLDDLADKVAPPSYAPAA